MLLRPRSCLRRAEVLLRDDVRKGCALGEGREVAGPAQRRACIHPPRLQMATQTPPPHEDVFHHVRGFAVTETGRLFLAAVVFLGEMRDRKDEYSSPVVGLLNAVSSDGRDGRAAACCQRAAAKLLDLVTTWGEGPAAALERTTRVVLAGAAGALRRLSKPTNATMYLSLLMDRDRPSPLAEAPLRLPTGARERGYAPTLTGGADPIRAAYFHNIAGLVFACGCVAFGETRSAVAAPVGVAPAAMLCAAVDAAFRKVRDGTNLAGRVSAQMCAGAAHAASGGDPESPLWTEVATAGHPPPAVAGKGGEKELPPPLAGGAKATGGRGRGRGRRRVIGSRGRKEDDAYAAATAGAKEAARKATATAIAHFGEAVTLVVHGRRGAGPAISPGLPAYGLTTPEHVGGMMWLATAFAVALGVVRGTPDAVARAREEVRVAREEVAAATNADDVERAARRLLLDAVMLGLAVVAPLDRGPAKDERTAAAIAVAMVVDDLTWHPLVRAAMLLEAANRVLATALP